ncbi:MAG TPA: GWxTD domain-containing protein [Acidobacteriota bacterium]
MAKARTAVIVLILLICAEALLAQVPSLKPKDLPSAYRKWLEEEVVYIITPLEREVFLKLQTDRERELFMEAFWKRRDPNPATEENEFKKEHYRRIGYANHYYGRTSTRAGWKTDRGRVYIILGPPNDVQSFESQSATYPAEIWFYQDQMDKGLPAGFNLVFYKKGGIGDFDLYSPVENGPMALLTSYWGDPNDYVSALEALQEAQPSLADVSMSLIPGENTSSLGRPSLSSTMLLQQVETAGWRLVEDKYAQKFLEYKDIVEVDYSANYLDSDSLVRIFRAPNGMFFIHYALEPARLSVSENEGRYFANFKFNGTLTGKAGQLAYQFEKLISFNFDQEQMKSINYQPFSIQDMFPLVAGSYKFSLLVKNELSKEFSTLEKNLVIPEDQAGPWITPLLLAYKATAVTAAADKLRPFQLAGNQLYAQPGRVFLKSDTLQLAFQVLGLDTALRSEGELVFDFFQNDQEFRTTNRPVRDYATLPELIESIPLADFPPAHYKVTVSLRLKDQTLASAGEEFDVTHREAMARPWVYAKVIPGPSDPVYLYIMGIQLYNQGRLEEAQTRLEKALSRQPDSAEFALSLAQTYLAQKDYDKADKLLSPFFGQAKPPQYELYIALARALQNGGQLRRAVEVLDQAITHYGVNAVMLNAMGECYLGLGQYEEARVVWEKSLQLSPDQAGLRKRLQELKEKR